MKNCLFLLFLVVSVLACKKSGLTDLDVNALYIKVPQIALDSNILTYEVDMDRFASGSVFGSSMNNINVENSISLNGYRKVNFGGDMQISVGVGEGYFNDRGVLSRKNKDKEGKEYYTYYREIEYANQAYYRLLDRNRRVLDEVEIMSRSNTKTYRTSDFSTQDQLNSWWKTNGNAQIEELRRNMMNDAVRGINSSLNSRYAWVETRERVEFKTIKDKENRRVKQWQINDAKVSEAFRTMTSFSTLEYEKRIMPCIEFWLDEYDLVKGSDEKSEYMRHACLYNIALAYYWMDDFQNAKLYANKGLGLNVGDGTMKSFLQRIDETQYRLRNVGLTRQHFDGSKRIHRA